MNSRVMLRRLLQSDSIVLVLCLVLLAVFGPMTPGLLSAANLGNIAGAMLPLLIVAAGQTLVLVGGGIDLSATSIIALTSVTGAQLMTGNAGWMAGHPAAVPMGVAAMLGTGALIGLANGTCVTRLGMPAFMVTLTTMMFLSGFAVWATASRGISGLPAGFLGIGQRLPVALGVAVLFAGTAHLLLTRSLAGHWLRAIGHNIRTAYVSGVPVAQVVTLSYVASGVSAAGASVLLTARLETGSPVLGQMMMLDVIGAAVIGGTSLFGGRGSVWWTVGGVLFLTLLDNVLSLQDVTHFKIMVIKGAVILMAAVLDNLRRKNEAA